MSAVKLKLLDTSPHWVELASVKKIIEPPLSADSEIVSLAGVGSSISVSTAIGCSGEGSRSVSGIDSEILPVMFSVTGIGMGSSISGSATIGFTKVVSMPTAAPVIVEAKLEDELNQLL